MDVELYINGFRGYKIIRSHMHMNHSLHSFGWYNCVVLVINRNDQSLEINMSKCALHERAFAISLSPYEIDSICLKYDKKVLYSHLIMY